MCGVCVCVCMFSEHTVLFASTVKNLLQILIHHLANNVFKHIEICQRRMANSKKKTHSAHCKKMFTPFGVFFSRLIQLRFIYRNKSLNKQLTPSKNALDDVGFDVLK